MEQTFDFRRLYRYKRIYKERHPQARLLSDLDVRQDRGTIAPMAKISPDSDQIAEISLNPVTGLEHIKNPFAFILYLYNSGIQ